MELILDVTDTRIKKVSLLPDRAEGKRPGQFTLNDLGKPMFRKNDPGTILNEHVTYGTQ